MGGPGVTAAACGAEFAVGLELSPDLVRMACAKQKLLIAHYKNDVPPRQVTFFVQSDMKNLTENPAAFAHCFSTGPEFSALFSRQCALNEFCEIMMLVCTHRGDHRACGFDHGGKNRFVYNVPGCQMQGGLSYGAKMILLNREARGDILEATKDIVRERYETCFYSARFTRANSIGFNPFTRTL